MTKPLIIRAKAVDACMSRFNEARLDYRKADCVRLARLALVKQGVKLPLMKGVRWQSALSAAKALKAKKHKTLADAMDATGLPRIAPAFALPGDIMALETDEAGPWGVSLVVNVGNGRVLGFVPAIEGLPVCVVFEPVRVSAAWRSI